MRRNDLKVREIALELGMLYKNQGDSTEYSKPIYADDLEMNFQYENPVDEAHIEVLENKRPHRSIAVFMGNELDINLIKEEFPQFFK